MSGGTRTNRLTSESSPYLRQHAANPVDWWPWGPEAFEEARRLDRPVFLSIGYSSCHWCHVMAHESFEDEELAGLLNRHFVPVKVDREERPDVDELYMTAVQITTGHGGWPLSAFLLPDGRPFFAGTYFPKDDHRGRPGFRTLLMRVAAAYRDEREEITETARQISEALVGTASLAEHEPPRPLSSATLDGLVSSLRRAFDPRHGGFGDAPKFPPHTALSFLLRRAAEGEAESLSLASRTLEAMALGGIHDHVAGGFHRYSTDARWFVPHFEKMLSDNGQLLASYAEAFALTGRPLFRRTAEGIAEYLLREMRGAEGAFYAATDADSEGEEGKFFVWTARELEHVLGPADAAFFAKVYGVSREGNWRDEATGRQEETNILHLAAEPDEGDERRLAPMRKKLFAARQERVPPGLDDKRISGWNALVLSGLAAAGRALKEPRYLEAAHVLAKVLLATMRDAEGRLLRSWKDGAGSVPAFLEDEAYLANALLDLSEVEEGEPAEQALRKAHAAVDALRRRFRRPGAAGFTFSGEGHERLLAPARDLFDKATPSGSASAARALARLARRTADPALAAEARAALDEVSGLLLRSPHGTETWHLALADLLAFEAAHGVALPAGARPEPVAAAGPVSLEATASASRLRPGDAAEVTVRIGIAHGWHLAEEGLAVEAQAGSGLAVESVVVPPAAELSLDGGEPARGWEGTVEARVVVSAKKPAIAGEWVVAVTARFRACGEGSCRPERALSVAVPLTVD